MAQRRRYATRDELADEVHEYVPEMRRVDVVRVLDTLVTLGVQVDALVKVTVDEPDPAAVFRTTKIQ